MTCWLNMEFLEEKKAYPLLNWPTQNAISVYASEQIIKLSHLLTLPTSIFVLKRLSPNVRSVYLCVCETEVVVK